MTNIDVDTTSLVAGTTTVVDFEADVLRGLTDRQKWLPCKYFYDARGSLLFDAITELGEYYVTRTEQAIMRQSIDEIASIFEPGSFLIEFGSGSSMKTTLLLDHLPDLAGYIPVDICLEHLEMAADKLRLAYPELGIYPVCGDYTQPFRLPRIIGKGDGRIVYFPGSTIGNFNIEDAAEFLGRIRHLCGDNGGLLIGVDLRKDVLVLEKAYNDREGVTAQFNLNILVRANRELGATFDVENGFAHYAFYNPHLSRIEMHLISRRDQTVRVAGRDIFFEEGETIFTETSYKHTLEGFKNLAASAGFRVDRVWTDPKRWFSVQYLRAA